MTKAITIASFDYSQVDKETKGKLISLAGRIKRLTGAWQEAGSAVAAEIVEAHKLLVPYRKGMFDDWLESEAGISRSQGYNLKNVSERAVDYPFIGQLPDTVGYLLAGPSVPEAAIKAVEKAVDKGELPTVKMVKAEIKKHSPNGKPRKSKKPPSQSDEPPTPAEDEGPEDEPDNPVSAAKLFAKCLEHLRLASLLMMDLKKIDPSEHYEHAFESLDLANKEICAWKRSAKKRA